MRKPWGLALTVSMLAVTLASMPAYAQTAQDTPSEPNPPGSDAIGAQDAEGENEDIVVTGIRASLGSAQAIKRNADQIVDAVVAEDIGKLPDNNAAEALARITGVQVNRFADEASGVLIRGLPNVATTLNGREIFTASGRAVAFQDFPADSLAGLEVFKATTAPNIEGGIAGLVNIRLRKPFDFKDELTVAGGGRVTYNDQSRKFDPIGNLLFSVRRDTGMGEVGLLLNASYTQTNYLNSVRFDGFRVSPGATQAIAPASVGRAITFPQDIGIYYERGKRWRPSINGAIQWRPTPELELYADGLWQAFRGRTSNDFLGVALRGGNPTLENVTLRDDGSGEVRRLSAQLVNAPDLFRSAADNDTDTYQFGAGAAYTTGRAKISTDLAYTDSTVTNSNYGFDTRLASAPRVNADIDVGYGVEFGFDNFDLTNPANHIFRGLFDARGRTDGKSIQWRADLELQTGQDWLPRIDAGFRYSDREASSVSGDRYAFVANSRIPLASLPLDFEVIRAGFRGSDIQPTRSWYQATRDSIRENINALRDIVRGAGATNFVGELPALLPVRQFAATEKIYTFYGQARYAFDLGVPIDGIVGARVANTVNRLEGVSQVTRPNPGNVPNQPALPPVISLEPTIQNQNYLDILPNASLIAHFTDQLQLRLSYTETLSRPGYNQINPALVVNQGTEGSQITFTGSSGNAALQPIRSTNYDASLEYYFSPTGSITVAGFYREIEGFISTYRVRETVPEFGVIDVFRPENAGSGELKGVEAAFTTFFDFLPGALAGFGTQLNYTYIEGTQSLPVAIGGAATEGALPGVAKHNFNIVGLYERSGLSARLAYNYRDEFVANYVAGGAVGFNAEFTRPTSRLDFSINYDITDQITVTGDATNLLGKPFENYFRDPIYPRDVRYEARVYSVGARFRF